MNPGTQPITGLYQHWPVRRKLLALIMATTTFALAVSAAGILIADSRFFRETLNEDLGALSEIIADTSTAALAFDDAKVAAETLSALRARPHLIAACIYRAGGTVFASYFRAGSTAVCPAPPTDGTQVSELDDSISLSRPILLSGRTIGRLTLLYDLDEIRQRRLLYGGTVIGIAIISGILAALFSSRLRKLITDPVFALVKTSTLVSTTNDYSVRAEKLTGDEMGLLVDAFNDMLGRIELRDEELKQLVCEYEEANKNLVRLNEDLERFAFVASHDLQEPLRMITVYTQLLQKRSLTDSSPQAAEYVSNIVSGTARMRALLEDLRTYLETGAPSDPPTAVDLNFAIEKAKANLAFAINSSRAVVTSVPMPSVNAFVDHLVPLFQNLIGNGIKYRGEKQPEVHISYDRAGDELRFRVSDNGIGIAPEFHSKIFVVFKRLHGPEIGGTGMGLAICKRVVERYGGEIRVESQLGKGATFVFTLPASLLVDASGEENEPGHELSDRGDPKRPGH
jgi:signal transduction histidine kinase